jgi:hypothetical protein
LSLTLGVRLLAVLTRSLGMLLGICRVFFALRVIALAMMFGGGAVSSRGILVMLGCLVMFVFGHQVFSGLLRGEDKHSTHSNLFRNSNPGCPSSRSANHDGVCEVARVALTYNVHAGVNS